MIGKDWLSDFKEKAIFLGENGLLYTADNIFFNIDPYKDDILAFLHHIPFLSLATRNYFDKEEKSLKKIESVLKVFDPKMFVDGILLADDNIEQTKSKLNNKKLRYVSITSWQQMLNFHWLIKTYHILMIMIRLLLHLILILSL